MHQNALNSSYLLNSLVRFEQYHDQFKARVGKVVQDCEARLYDSPNSDDPHAIRYKLYKHFIG